MQIRVRDIRQNKTDRVRKLLSIQQCPDCDFYDRQIEVLQPGQQYEVLNKSSECPGCKSRNFASVISEEDAESSFNLDTKVFEKKQGKYRHILLEGRPYSDGSGCTCPPFRREMELKAASKGEKDWEPTMPMQICPHCDKEYHLDWTITERTYL